MAELVTGLKLAVAAMIMAVGMSARPSEFAALLRRPGLLIRSLMAIYVVVPAAAILCAAALPLPDGFKLALLVLAASGGAPLLPRKLMTLGNHGYVFGLVALSSVVAIVAAPAWLAAIAPWFGRTLTLGTGEVAMVIAKSFLGPLALGLAIRALAPAWSLRWSERVLQIGGAALLAAAVAILALNAEVLAGAGWFAIAALVGFSALALVIGHLMGGPDPRDRTALAVICATRHIGVAALLAASAPGPRALVLLLTYVLAATAVSLPYLWLRRGATEETATSP